MTVHETTRTRSNPVADGGIPMSDVTCRAESREDGDERDDAHLDGVEVGAGCTEIWEHLADQREE